MTAKKPTKQQRVESCDSKDEVIAFADSTEEIQINEKDGNVQERQQNKYLSSKLNASSSKEKEHSKENQTKELYQKVYETRRVANKLYKSDSQKGNFVTTW